MTEKSNPSPNRGLSKDDPNRMIPATPPPPPPKERFLSCPGEPFTGEIDILMSDSQPAILDIENGLVVGWRSEGG